MGHKERNIGCVERNSGGELGVNREIIDPDSVEVRIGDPETDAPRLRELYTQPSTLEHLAGITPNTTEEDIKELYKGDNIILLTAESPSGLIVGTTSIQKPGFGSRVGEIMRVVVDEEYRNLDIARKLLKSSHALMFRKGGDDGDGSIGLGCTKSQIFVIINVDNEQIPQRLFGSEGYVRGQENRNTTYSWSNRSRRIVNRSSQPMSLEREWYIRHRSGEHIRYLPESRTPNI
jgi:ribosomal protein S18 acetylase RimI-like enzyme